MTTLSVQPSYPIFVDRAGKPLKNGYVWIGAANLNAITNPIAIYWDAALTQPAVQPVRTLNGYPANNGTPGRLYVNSDFSITVQDSKGTLVYSAPSVTDRYSDVVVTGVSSSEVSFLQAGTGAQPRTAQSKLRDVVSVKDFGAVGDGITNDAGAFQLAINTMLSKGGGLYIPAGDYKISNEVSIPAAVWVPFLIQGAAGSKIISPHNGIVFNDASGAVRFNDLVFEGPSNLNASAWAIKSALGLGWVKGCSFSGYYYGIECSGTTAGLIERNRFSLCQAGVRATHVAPAFGNMLNLLRNYFDFNVYGVYLEEMFGVVFDTNAFEFNSEAAYLNNVRGIEERGANWYESNTTCNMRLVGSCAGVRGPATRVVSSSDIVDWANTRRVDELVRRIAVLRKTSSQSIPHNNSTGISWEVEDVDPSGMHTGAETICTITVPGTYRVTAQIEFAGFSSPGAAVIARIDFMKNGSAFRSTSSRMADGVPTQVSGSVLVQCGNGDTLSVNAYQNTGGALNINAGNASGFSIEFVSID
jgi:hypothetical protein